MYTLNQDLTEGTKVTVFYINAIAATSKLEATIHGKTEQYGYYGKLKGKRKQVHFLPKEQEHIVFKGWDLPIKCDSETNQFIGNACFNFLGETKETVREFLTTNSLIDLTPRIKDKINFVEQTEEFQDNIYTNLFQ